MIRDDGQMRFDAPARKPRGESIVPMINVVFLLLVFFLMTAQLAPPEPFDIARPQASAGDTPEGTQALYVSAEGALHYMGADGDAALAALAAAPPTGPLTIRADARLPGARMAKVLKQLAAAGLSRVELVVDTAG